MQADTTLTPCPFCGAQAHFEVDDDRWEWVECESCGMQGNRSASLMESCKPKLAEAWNRRAPAPANDALEKAVRKLHAAKGRHHNQIAACDLYDLLGLPNVRPGQEPAPPTQEARVPLSDGQIEQGHDAADIAPTDATIGTFTDGVRFAEKHHGITAAQKETP